ncbi:hypothetical protein HYH02_002459 [Chlamydomonas schloesseri]|uniref:Protein kinase domain-containing protein n=1 Tax=Chlamydomonas schloesseri TaxID=2026947 RepID=A0A835WSG8_9CHLO|nr:hypothetical protein HYH02_002459 [Chlamydomonas schloesseri]|eukprot:KAG2453132.1 hypothetical protein HYH02_002459 [Chlamydomonas schloesseri]
MAGIGTLQRTLTRSWACVLLLSGLALVSICGAQTSGSTSGVLVTNTKELQAALGNPAVETVLLNDSVVLTGADWGNVLVTIDRNVTVTATPERIASRVYVSLDFANLIMLFQISAGYRLTFRGLEILNHFDTVGPTFRPLRQSIGAWVVFEDCVQRRRAGLPYEAAVVNMIAAARPADVTGPQVAFIISDWSYATTRFSRRINDSKAISMLDYQTTTAPDSSLAFQGLHYGGYTYSTQRCYYGVDNFVPQSCLDSKKPGSECVALLLQQLDSGNRSTPTASPTAAPNSDGSSSDVAVIVPAVVVPVAVVLLLGMGVLVWVRRQKRQQAYAKSGGPGGADVESNGGKGSGAMQGSGAQGSGAVEGVFMGLEENQQLPEWTPMLADEERDLDEDEDDAHCATDTHHQSMQLVSTSERVGGDTSGSAKQQPQQQPSPLDNQAPSAQGAEAKAELAEEGKETSDQLAKQQQQLATNGGSRRDGSPRRPGSSQLQQNEPLPRRPTQSMSGTPAHNLAPAAAAIAARAAAAAGSTAATADGHGKASVAAATGNGNGEAGPALAAGGVAGGAGRDEGGKATPSGGVGSSRVQPTQQQLVDPPSDMLAELGRMAAELRSNVKDVAIKLEGVIGSGSFGTVYKGTWQGLPVAIKTVVFTASQDSRRRALSEAALCQSISHHNIIATYASELQPIGVVNSTASAGSSSQEPSGGTPGGGLGQPPSGGGGALSRNMAQIVDWRLYIVQEFADGGPLRKLYGNKAIWMGNGQVDLPAIVGLALGMARALSHLHSKRIIHGDLNPNNVLLKRDMAEPSGYAIKVGDFGLSVLLPQHRTHLSNVRMGTMFYMCPAVVLKAQVGPASDVFSLGVILWELYNGRRAGVRTDQGPRYCSIFPAFPPSCPEAYRAVTLHCLQRQPQNRPTAAAVEEHLEQLLGSLMGGMPPQPPRDYV